jgi:hypothetical protein
LCRPPSMPAMMPPGAPALNGSGTAERNKWLERQQKQANERGVALDANEEGEKLARIRRAPVAKPAAKKRPPEKPPVPEPVVAPRPGRDCPQDGYLEEAGVKEEPEEDEDLRPGDSSLEPNAGATSADQSFIVPRTKAKASPKPVAMPADHRPARAHPDALAAAQLGVRGGPS